MTIEGRAADFVRRTDAALADLGRAEEIWSTSARSNTEEMRLHSMSVDLDKAIRKVAGKFDRWTDLDPSQVAKISDDGPINMLWVISAHPSGRVREEFVHRSAPLADDKILPHLANRTIDFVPAIRQLASPLVMARLQEVLDERTRSMTDALLPTAAHIAITKLLAPRTAMLSPELTHLCIAVAQTAESRPARLRTIDINRMLDRCHQTLEAASEPTSREALVALIAYLNEPTT